MPTFTGSQTDRRTEGLSSPKERGAFSSDPGLDVRWSITPNLSLNGTLNPDFSQIEADVAQLDVNNRFALFFPEKRPFFLEGADFFDTSIPAVFSRTISDPTYGAKVTGKMGSTAIGAIIARDAVTNLLIPGREGSSSTFIETTNTTHISRLRQDIGSASTLGLLYTGREGAAYHNRVGGIDLQFRPRGPFQLNAQWLRSSTRYPLEIAESHGQNPEAFLGDAMRLRLQYSTRTWFANSNLWSNAPAFRADAGFVPQVDFRGIFAEAGRHIWGDGSWFTRIVAWVGGETSESFDNLLVKKEIWYWLSYEGPLQSFVWIWPRYSKERFAGKEYAINYSEMYIGIRPTGKLNMSVLTKVGDEIDFSNAREASTFRVTSSAEARLNRRVTFTLDHTYQRLHSRQSTIFKVNLIEFRTAYFFSPRMFVRLILQYQQTIRRPEQYNAPVDPTSKGLFSQFLFSYKLNPQSVLFLGFSDTRAGLTDPSLQRFPLKQTDRTVFLKAGYAWRP